MDIKKRIVALSGALVLLALLFPPIRGRYRGGIELDFLGWFNEYARIQYPALIAEIVFILVAAALTIYLTSNNVK